MCGMANSIHIKIHTKYKKENQFLNLDFFSFDKIW